jgi:RNA polymerase sigma factor (sigma-70 family)
MSPPGATEQDSNFWRALRRQDGMAYDELAALVSTVAAPVFRRSGASRETVDQLVQDVLVSIYEYSSTEPAPAPPKNLRGFVYWRARGVWTEWLRREHLREIPLSETPSISIDGEPAVDPLTVDELGEALEGCRDGLGEKYRYVLEARYEQGRDSQEIADELGIERAQVAVRLHRARKSLQECLKKRGVLE